QAVAALETLFNPPPATQEQVISPQEAGIPVSPEAGPLRGGAQAAITAPVAPSEQIVAQQARQEQFAPIFQTLAATRPGREQISKQVLGQLFAAPGLTEEERAFQKKTGALKAETEFGKKPKEQILKDVAGRQRYVDSQELVFPNVEDITADSKRRVIKDAQGIPRYEDDKSKVFTHDMPKEIQTKMLELDEKIGGLDEMERTFTPEFLTYKGKIDAATVSLLQKVGFKTKGQFLEARSKWFAQAKTAFLAYRKSVTGVAGGEKEFKEIAKAFPNPDTDSPSQFTAKLNQVREFSQIVKRWLSGPQARGLTITDTRELMVGEGLLADGAGLKKGSPKKIGRFTIEVE
ncbi:MAG: hypothetical protein KAR06_05790, partial [Deltaproteobacteria bacterium]|nr:hypothetical protein [Deltaproteobacteria bacterium]